MNNPFWSLSSTVGKWLLVAPLVALFLPLMMETLKNLWLNWGWSHPYLSTLGWMIVAAMMWWSFGFIVWASTIKSKEKDKSAEQPSQNFNVTSSNQQGGITAGIVNVQPGTTSKDATLRSENNEQRRQPDGSFLTTAVFIVDSPFPVGNLSIEVHGRSITDLDIGPMRSGAFILGLTGKREGYCFTNIPNAFGRYQVSIKSREAENFEIIYNVD